MKYKLPFILLLSLLSVIAPALAEDISYSVDRIWGDGSRHCAFTSLIKWKGNYYCAFREGFNHVFNEKGEADGIIRIITSPDGNKWESCAVLTDKGYDLRDPKLSETPDGRLMLNFGRLLYRNQQLVSLETQVCFSKNGKDFSKPHTIVITPKDSVSGLWLWRVTWHEGTGYGVNYAERGGNNVLQLVCTEDGINYHKLKTFDIKDSPNEATVRFTADNRMLIFVRRDGGSRSTILLSSLPPYTDWQQRDLGFHCGGPDALALPDGRILLSGRSEHIPRRATNAIYTLSIDGRVTESMVLPSSGDCSYPSLLVVGDTLWVTYYSTHATNKPSIYLARIPLKYFKVYY